MCEGGIEIALELSQSDLADLTGSARETVNRVLGDLRDDGLVSLPAGTRIIVRDLEGLLRLQA